jgi:hypothetical protein
VVSARPPIYEAAHAARLTPGARWRPANGHEGEVFWAVWCAECAADIDGGCPIFAVAAALRLDDPDYPAEWAIDAAGQPGCAAFRPIGAVERCAATPDLFA